MNAGAIRGALMAWYREHGRHGLAWRLTRDPYAVLVSEIMLQQTQVERVLPYYHAWLARWPDASALAAESPAEVIRAWSGLGYNRRALNLHRAAVAVVEQYGGTVPPSVPALLALPGIGPYTANAVACFAFEQRVPVADANIGRVLARLVYGVAAAREVPAKAIDHAAGELLPREGGRDHNLALMDLGAMVCTARNPACDDCPVQDHCAWLAAGRPDTGTARQGAATPFVQTARFARGRIVDALRVRAPRTTADLRAILPEQHKPKVDTYLAGLTRDGLIVETLAGWSLPGEE